MKSNVSRIYSAGERSIENIILIFGTRPEEGVNMDTEMVNEIAAVMNSKLDKTNFFIKLPDVFDKLKSKDAKFEMVVSGTIQPLKLFYSENVITHSKAVIFVNDRIDKRKQFNEE